MSRKFTPTPQRLTPAQQYAKNKRDREVGIERKVSRVLDPPPVVILPGEPNTTYSRSENVSQDPFIPNPEPSKKSIVLPSFHGLGPSEQIDEDMFPSTLQICRSMRKKKVDLRPQTAVLSDVPISDDNDW